MANITELEKTLRNVSKQAKFAQARALTRVARSIQEKEQQNIENTFDNPTPFTIKSVKSIGARRDNLQAKVFIQDIAANYLEPYEHGGVHKLSGKVLLNPKNIRLNKYGNMPRGKVKNLAAKDDVFMGSVDTAKGKVSGVWQRKKVRKSKKKGSQRGNLKLLVRFGEALPVKQDLGFYDVAQDTFMKEYPGYFRDEVANAFATAK